MIFKSVEAYVEALRQDPDLTMIPLGLVAELKGISRSAVAEQIRTGALEGIAVKGQRKTWRGVRPTTLFAQAERARHDAEERTARLGAALAAIAATGQPATYAQAMEAVGMASKNPRQRAEIGELLAAASKDSFAQNGFLIGAIVVQKSSGQPNSLFFHLAREVGALADEADQAAFWQDQCARVFAHYAPPPTATDDTAPAAAEPAPAPKRQGRRAKAAKTETPAPAAEPAAPPAPSPAAGE